MRRLTTLFFILCTATVMAVPPARQIVVRNEVSKYGSREAALRAMASANEGPATLVLDAGEWPLTNTGTSIEFPATLTFDIRQGATLIAPTNAAQIVKINGRIIDNGPGILRGPVFGLSFAQMEWWDTGGDTYALWAVSNDAARAFAFSGVSLGGSTVSDWTELVSSSEFASVSSALEADFVLVSNNTEVLSSALTTNSAIDSQNATAANVNFFAISNVLYQALGTNVSLLSLSTSSYEIVTNLLSGISNVYSFASDRDFSTITAASNSFYLVTDAAALNANFSSVSSSFEVVAGAVNTNAGTMVTNAMAQNYNFTNVILSVFTNFLKGAEGYVEADFISGYTSAIWRATEDGSFIAPGVLSGIVPLTNSIAGYVVPYVADYAFSTGAAAILDANFRSVSNTLGSLISTYNYTAHSVASNAVAHNVNWFSTNTFMGVMWPLVRGLPNESGSEAFPTELSWYAYVSNNFLEAIDDLELAEGFPGFISLTDYVTNNFYTGVVQPWGSNTFYPRVSTDVTISVPDGSSWADIAALVDAEASRVLVAGAKVNYQFTGTNSLNNSLDVDYMAKPFLGASEVVISGEGPAKTEILGALLTYPEYDIVNVENVASPVRLKDIRIRGAAYVWPDSTNKVVGVRAYGSKVYLENVDTERTTVGLLATHGANVVLAGTNRFYATHNGMISEASSSVRDEYSADPEDQYQYFSLGGYGTNFFVPPAYNTVYNDYVVGDEWCAGILCRGGSEINISSSRGLVGSPYIGAGYPSFGRGAAANEDSYIRFGYTNILVEGNFWEGVFVGGGSTFDNMGSVITTNAYTNSHCAVFTWYRGGYSGANVHKARADAVAVAACGFCGFQTYGSGATLIGGAATIDPAGADDAFDSTTGSTVITE